MYLARVYFVSFFIVEFDWDGVGATHFEHPVATGKHGEAEVAGFDDIQRCGRFTKHAVNVKVCKQQHVRLSWLPSSSLWQTVLDTKLCWLTLVFENDICFS